MTIKVPSALDGEWGIIADVVSASGAGGQLLTPELFTDEDASRIAEIIRAHIESKVPVMAETVARSCNPELAVKFAQKLTTEGGPGIAYWLPVLKEKLALRKVQSAACDILLKVGQLEPEKRPIADDIRTLLSTAAADLAGAGLTLDDGKRISMRENLDALTDALQAADCGEQPPTVPTGIESLDRVLGGGLRSREMTVIGARTSVGKSALACWITRSACNAGKRVLYASREMGTLQLTERLASIEAGVPVRTCDGTTRMSELEKRCLLGASARIKEWDLYLRDDLRSIAAVRAEAVAIKPDLIVIDHIGIFQADVGRKASAYEAATFNSNAARDLAFDTGVSVLVLAQVNRAGADVDEPRLDHLKNTGALEEDARAVILLHRVEEISAKVQILKLNLAKNTSGRLRSIRLQFDASICTFTDELEMPDRDAK